ncbi:MAG TPA: NUDIX hydrolase [Roseiflexaceae bacterium]|jgi:ADP-ribose pyrophosphatase YjhB (NUDIX family)|nr:NUDIX hydrolase [Roseiflexaceae bacterium]
MTNAQWQKLRFCSRCGAELGSHVANGRERPACPACGFVVYLDPKVACGVLIERAGCVLLVQRRFEPGRGLWCLPAGFEDADESPEEAARREAQEETGLDATLNGLLGVYHYTDDPRGAGILLIYRAQIAPDAEPIAGDDAQAAAFFAPDALPAISHHTHRAALNDWINSRARA